MTVNFQNAKSPKSHGVHYSKLIVPLLKRVQQLGAELATLKGA